MSSFADYIEMHSTAPQELPLVHTTDYYRLPSIRTTNMLQTHPCTVFKEAILYLFYGRPAYRDALRTSPTRDVGLYPVCFVFRPGTALKKIKRLYPFDTGAAQDGRYEPDVNRTNAITAYRVTEAIDSARRIVKCFFETNEQYLCNKPKSGLAFASTEIDAESYYRLINGGGDPDCDDRRSAVEIQVANSLDLRDDLIAVALPTCFLEDASLAHTLLHVWHAQPLTYYAVSGMRPNEVHGMIRQLVHEFYLQSSFL